MPRNTQLQNDGSQMGTLDLWNSSLLLYHLSHANHVHVRNC
jgi:hypothetical protein